MALKNISVKFQYYRPYCFSRTDGSAKELVFDFEDWINAIDKIDLSDRTRENQGNTARLEQWNYIPEHGMYGLRFMRMRSDQIPYLVREGDVAEPLDLEDDEYIGEDLTALFHAQLNVLMIQINRNSLTINALTHYLNDIFADVDVDIILQKIGRKDIDFRNIKKDRYSKLELGIDLPKQQAPKSNFLTGPTIESAINMFGKYNGRALRIGISMEHAKEGLSNKAVEDLLKEIQENRDIVKTAKLSCADEGDKTEVLDLLELTMCDYIRYQVEARTSLGFRYAVEEMIPVFERRIPQF